MMKILIMPMPFLWGKEIIGHTVWALINMDSWFLGNTFQLLKDTRDSGLKVEATEAWISETPILRYDGSYHHGTKINSVSAKELDQKVKKHITSSLPNWLGRKEKINDSRRQLFERWIDCMISENKQIVFWLPPYHPSVYNAILENDDYKIVLDSERYLREYAASKGIKILGSYNPSLLGLTQNDFFDGMHMKEESMDEYLGDRLQYILSILCDDELDLRICV